MYHEKRLASCHSVPSPVTALWFGRYGREDDTLVTLTKSGSLDIKVWGVGGCGGRAVLALFQGRHVSEFDGRSADPF